MIKKNIHKILIFIFLVFAKALIFSEAINNMQLYKADSWIYKSLDRLGTESGVIPVTSFAPLTAVEIKIYFSDIDREKLSDSGKELYDKVEEFLYAKPKNFSFGEFSVAPNLKITPEFYAKTNKDIDWTYIYYYKDNLISTDVMLSFSDYFLFDVEPFLGKNYGAMHKEKNFSNLIFGIGDTEFQSPRWANFSTGYNFQTWGFDFVIGKEGLQIGRTLTGSLVLNNTFMTDMFAKFSVYSKVFKMTNFFAEVSHDKYFYYHQLEVRPFKKIRLTVGEGVLVADAFEPRFLIPIMPYHSYAAWHEYNQDEREYYSESRFCDYLAVMLEFSPIPTSRFYIYYTQNELQDPWESKETPNSFGWQVGTETSFSAPANGYWNFGLEWIWTTPYLYIKHGAPWSLYRDYDPNHQAGTGKHVYSWIGSPFGPDCMGGAVKFGYEKSQKWSVDLMWIFTAHGENGILMFDEKVKDKNGNEWYYYYPSVKYDHPEDCPDKTKTIEQIKSEAMDDALNILPSGVVEYKNQVAVKGTYNFNRHFQLNGQVVYIFAYNFKNVKDNFQQGAEFTISGTYSLF